MTLKFDLGESPYDEIGEIFTVCDDIFDAFEKTHSIERITNDIIEECSELITMIQHKRRGRVGGDAVAGEFADVLILLHSAMRCRIVDPDRVIDIIKEKLLRTEDRLKKGDLT